MNQFSFDPKHDAIVCRVEIFDKERHLTLRMIVDTGATYTMIPRSAAHVIGDPRSHRIVEIMTGSRIEKAPLITVPTFKALGFAVHHFPVIVHDLPARGPVDGLLGLNFLKRSKAIIDFSKNAIFIRQAMLERIKREGFDGLEFKIQTIVPVANLPLLLGLTSSEGRLAGV